VASCNKNNILSGGLDVVRKKAKDLFRQNAHLRDEAEIKKAVARGRYVRQPLMRALCM
jgi:hypothetical protein